MRSDIDNVQVNDNRAYDYTNHGFYVRSEFPIICDWISTNTKIIDLGCGNGSLMKYISDRKNVKIEGIERMDSGVKNCLLNGLVAHIGDIDICETYRTYRDNEFDFAICNVTLQMLMYPDILLTEIERIAKQSIISFPNFAYIGNRCDLLFGGRMPRPMLHGYEWFNTGHIHQLSIYDFEKWCITHGWKILDKKQLGCFAFIANHIWANLFSKEAIYLVSK